MNKQITWEYLAGFLDGEGNIRIINYPNRRSSTRGVSVTLAQGIENNGERIMNLIAEFLKNYEIKTHIYRYKESTDKRGISRKPMYILKISDKYSVAQFLELIKDKLLIKKETAEKTLDFIKTLRKHTRPLNLEEKKKIKQLYQNGYSHKMIANEIKCGETKIYNFLKSINLLPKHGSLEWKARISLGRKRGSS